MPYLPYFSNCRGFGRHIPLYVAFENSAWCSLQTVVNTQPVNVLNVGSSPLADECVMTTKCVYEEVLTNPSGVSSFPRWYEKNADAQTLFYFSAEPMDYDGAAASAAELSLLSGVSVSVSSVLASTLTEFVGGDKLIPVIVKRDQNAPASSVPRLVTLNINFRQVDQTKKSIVSADLLLSQYDIDLNDINYQFTIRYSALNYFGLINLFSFSLPVYLILFGFIGLISVLAAFLFWLSHRLLTKTAIPPVFRFWSYVKLTVPPPVVAIVYVGGPVGVMLAICWYVITDQQLLDVYTGSYSDLGTENVVTSAAKATYRAGRFGIVLFGIGMYCIWCGTHLLIPKKHKEDMHRMRLYRSVPFKKNGDWSPKPWKRWSYIIMSVLFGVAAVFLFEFSYSSLFSQNVVLWIVFLRLSQRAVHFVLVVVHREALLTVPFLIVYVSLQYVLTMGAATFTDFVISYFANMCCLLFLRIHQTGVQRWITDKMIRAYTVVAPLFSLSVDSDLVKGSGGGGAPGHRRTASTVAASKEAAEAAQTGAAAPKLRNSEVVDPVVNHFGWDVYETMAIYFTPVVFAFVIVFRTESEIAILYKIGQLNMVYYLIFAMLIIPAKLVMDIFILNISELYYGWKCYDYRVYAQYRFDHRSQRWMAYDPNMDMAVSRPYRSMDHLCFSPQMYFTCSLHACGVLMITLGMEIILHQKYILFADMVAPILFVTCIVMCHTMRLVAEEIADLLGIWTVDTVRIRIPPPEPGTAGAGAGAAATIANAQAAAATAGTAGGAEGTKPVPGGTGKAHTAITDDLVPQWDAAYRLLVERLRASKFLTPQRLTDDAFRARFIRHNRDWLAAMIGGGPATDPVTGKKIISPGLINQKTIAGAKFATAGYFVRQLGRLLLADRARNAEIEISSSSASDDGDKNKAKKKQRKKRGGEGDTHRAGPQQTVAVAKEMVAGLSVEKKAGLKSVALLWLHAARFRRELFRLATPIVRSHTGPECHLCHARATLPFATHHKPGSLVTSMQRRHPLAQRHRKNHSSNGGGETKLVCRLDPSMHSLIAMYEVAHWPDAMAAANGVGSGLAALGGGSTNKFGIDSHKWSKFVTSRASFQTLCTECEAAQTEVARKLGRHRHIKAMARLWLTAVRAHINAGGAGGAVPTLTARPTAIAVSSDSSSDEDRSDATAAAGGGGGGVMIHPSASGGASTAASRAIAAAAVAAPTRSLVLRWLATAKVRLHKQRKRHLALTNPMAAASEAAATASALLDPMHSGGGSGVAGSGSGSADGVDSALLPPNGGGTGLRPPLSPLPDSSPLLSATDSPPNMLLAGSPLPPSRPIFQFNTTNNLNSLLPPGATGSDESTSAAAAVLPAPTEPDSSSPVSSDSVPRPPPSDA